MLRFAANLWMLFTERPFLERFEAAAAAGFRAAKLLLPMSWQHRLPGRAEDGLGWLRRA